MIKLKTSLAQKSQKIKIPPLCIFLNKKHITLFILLCPIDHSVPATLWKKVQENCQQILNNCQKVIGKQVFIKFLFSKLVQNSYNFSGVLKF